MRPVWKYFLAWFPMVLIAIVNGALRLMQKAQEEERLHPMTEAAAELQRYGAAQAKKLGIKSDKDMEI